MWTEKDIKHMENKIILITGSNSGIGFFKALHLAKNNAHVIMGVRSIKRGEEAKKRILKEYSEAKIDIIQLDLNSKLSIEKCASTFKEKYQSLDILINNAGIMTTPYQPTEDGFESQIGVNHFGHFYLTYLLFDVLKKSKGAKIINTASIAHKFGTINPDTFLYDKSKKYSKQTAYAQSKLANLLFTYKLATLVKEANLDIKVLASHPGISKTNLGRHIRGNIFTEIVLWFAGILRQSGEKGALPGLLAASDKNAVNGSYYGPRGLYHTKGYPKVHKSNGKSHNKELQDLLWSESEKLLGITFAV